MNQAEVLRPGEKLHIVMRRLFEDDLRRHFIGEVLAVQDEQVRLRGYAFIFDTTMNQFVKRPETRTRVLKLDNTIILNVLPEAVALSDLVYTQSGRSLVLSDNRGFSLDINEFGVNR